MLLPQNTPVIVSYAVRVVGDESPPSAPRVLTSLKASAYASLPRAGGVETNSCCIADFIQKGLTKLKDSEQKSKYDYFFETNTS